MKLNDPNPLYSCACSIAALVFLAADVRAAEPITLDALVSQTVAKNPELKFYEAEIAAAKGERITAGEWANPELTAELGGKRVRDLSGNKLGDGAVWSVSLTQLGYSLLAEPCAVAERGTSADTAFVSRTTARAASGVAREIHRRHPELRGNRVSPPKALDCGSLLPPSSASLLALGRTDVPQRSTPTASNTPSPLCFGTPKDSSPAGWLRKAAAGCRSPKASPYKVAPRLSYGVY